MLVKVKIKQTLCLHTTSQIESTSGLWCIVFDLAWLLFHPRVCVFLEEFLLQKERDKKDINSNLKRHSRRSCFMLAWRQYLMKRDEMLIFALLLPFLVGPDLWPAVVVSIICFIPLVLMRAVRNLVAPPIVIITDSKEFAFNFPTRYRIDVSRSPNELVKVPKNTELALAQNTRYRSVATSNEGTNETHGKVKSCASLFWKS